jgi:hypothetical protein
MLDRPVWTIKVLAVIRAIRNCRSRASHYMPPLAVASVDPIDIPIRIRMRMGRHHAAVLSSPVSNMNQTGSSELFCKWPAQKPPEWSLRPDGSTLFTGDASQ